MEQSPAHLRPAVAASLLVWHVVVASRNVEKLGSITHPDAAFRSPIANSPYRSAPALVLAIGTALQVLEDFEYHRQLASDDGLSVFIEFSARVGDRRLKGGDLIRFDEDGKIVEFEVLVRPLSGLQALGAEMGARLGQHMPIYKDKAMD
jgi:hypothetical protein